MDLLTKARLSGILNEAFEIIKEELPDIKKDMLNVLNQFDQSKDNFKSVEKKTTTTTTTTVEPKTEKKVTLSGIIDELPDGNVELVNSPYHYFKVLDVDSRKKYLSGIDPLKVISKSAIKKATEEGADKTIALEVIKYHKEDRPIETDLLPVKLPEKTQQFITNAIEQLGEDFSVLFNYMGEAGLSKQVIYDYRDIVQAVNKGHI